MFAARTRERHFAVPLVVLAILLGLVVTPFIVAPAPAAGASYYADSVHGNDGNSGTSSGSPWRAMGPGNSRSFSASDTVNLARGSTLPGAIPLYGSTACL